MLTEIMTDSRAIFSSFGNNIYMSDFVNNCIDRIATEISKVDVMSVVVTENSYTSPNVSITVTEETLQNGRISYGTAIGMFKSVVSLVLVVTVNAIAKKAGEEGVY